MAQTVTHYCHMCKSQTTSGPPVVSVLLNTLSEVEKSPVPSFRNWVFSLKPFWTILTTVRIRGFSTAPKKGIFLNPTRGFAIVPAREFLRVTTRVISFSASLRRSISRTGKSLNANKTLFEKYDNSQLIIHSPPTVFLLTCSVRRNTRHIRRDDTYCAVSLLQHKPYAKPFLEGYSETLTESCFESCQASISRENKTDLPKEIRRKQHRFLTQREPSTNLCNVQSRQTGFNQLAASVLRDFFILIG